MAAAQSSKTFWLWVWAILLLMEWGVVIALVPPERIAQTITNEKETCVRQLGTEACLEIKQASDGLFKKMAIDTGMRDASYNYFVGQYEESYNVVANLDDRGFGHWSVRLLQTTWGSLYIVLWRACTAFSWFPWFGFITLACVVDGIVRWKIGQWRFSYRSPMVHYISLYAIFASAMLFLFILILPFTITPLWTPMLILASLASLWALIGNMSKRV